MDIILKSCNNCIDKPCDFNCFNFILHRIKREFKSKGWIDITTTNTTYHFDKQNAKMKVSNNLLIVDVTENNIEVPIFFHKDQIIKVE